MERKDIHEMIAMLMESLREQTQTVASYEGRIPQIELDIVMSNLRKVYDYCSKLNLLNQGMGLVRMGHDEVVVQPVSTKAAVGNLSPAGQALSIEPASEREANESGLAALSSAELVIPALHPSREVVISVEKDPVAQAGLAAPFIPPVSENANHLNRISDVPSAFEAINPVSLRSRDENRTERAGLDHFDKIESIREKPDELPRVEPLVAAGKPEVELETPKAKVTFDDSKNSVSVTDIPSPVGARSGQEVGSRASAPGSPLFSEPSTVRPLAGKPEQKATRSHDPDLFNPVAPILAETLITDSKPSVADRFADKQTDQNLASRLGQKTIGDMKEAIGINDKFLLINELFKGNQHHYNQALHFLNNAESLDEAMGMFSRMYGELKWRDDSKAVGKLRSLIERRHGG